MRQGMRLFAVAGCVLSQSGGFEKETSTLQGYISVVQQLASGTTVVCVAKDDPALKSVTITLPSEGKAPEVRIQEHGKALENFTLLDSKVEKERLFVSVLDMDLARALEITLSKNDQGAWSGEFVDVGVPGNPSQTFTLSCR